MLVTASVQGMNIFKNQVRDKRETSMMWYVIWMLPRPDAIVLLNFPSKLRYWNGRRGVACRRNITGDDWLLGFCGTCGFKIATSALSPNSHSVKANGLSARLECLLCVGKSRFSIVMP